MRVEPYSNGRTSGAVAPALLAAFLVPLLSGCADRSDRPWLPHFELGVPAEHDGRVPLESVRVEGHAVAADGVGLLTWSLNDGPASADFDELDLATGFFAVQVAPLVPGANELLFRMEDRTGRTASERLALWSEDRPPELEILEPEEGRVVDRSGVAISGLVRDDFGLASAELLVGDADAVPIPLEEHQTWPGEVILRHGTGRLPPGEVTLTLVVTDLAGQRAEASVRVEVWQGPSW